MLIINELNKKATHSFCGFSVKCVADKYSYYSRLYLEETIVSLDFTDPITKNTIVKNK